MKISAATDLTPGKPPPIQVVRAIPADGPLDSFLRGVFGLERPAVSLVVAGVFSSSHEAEKQRAVLEKSLSQQPTLIVRVVRSPFLGASEKNFVLVGDPSARKKKPTKFILDELKPVVFSDDYEAQTIAKSIGATLGREVQIADYIK